MPGTSHRESYQASYYHPLGDRHAWQRAGAPLQSTGRTATRMRGKPAVKTRERVGVHVCACMFDRSMHVCVLVFVDPSLHVCLHACMDTTLNRFYVSITGSRRSSFPLPYSKSESSLLPSKCKHMNQQCENARGGLGKKRRKKSTVRG